MSIPLEPPAEYVDELVDYLHLEYGESKEDPDALKASDLKYVGLFAIDGLPTYYWSYAGSKGTSHYATQAAYENTYCLGMTDDAPAEAARIQRSEDCPPLRMLDLGTPRSVPWYRWGPIGAVWNMFTMGRVIRSTVKYLHDVQAQSEAMSHLPMAALLPAFIAAMRSEGNDSHAALRPSAPRTAIVEAQARLGAMLPESVVAFYQESDGLQWHNCLRNEPLPPLAELRWGREYDPPMSQRFRKAWEEDGREGGEPESLQVTADDLAGAFGGDAQHVDFAATDGMLALSRADGANVLLLNMEDLPGLPRGAILEAEGIYTTRYRDLARWISAQAAMFGSLKAMAEK